MSETMNLEPITHTYDWLWSGIVVVIGWVVVLLSPQNFLIFLTIILTLIKITHSVVLLRRDLSSNKNIGGNKP